MEQKRDVIKNWNEWDKFESNPFRDDLMVIPVKMARKAADPNRVMLVKDTGEEKTLHFNFSETRENEAFTKIFNEHVRLMFDLSKTAMKMFWFISTRLTPNNEIVNVPRDLCMEFCFFKTPKSFFDGISELLDRKLIAKTDKEEYYYINPVVFFNGNRMRITTSFIKPKDKIEYED